MSKITVSRALEGKREHKHILNISIGITVPLTGPILIKGNSITKPESVHIRAS